jgi:hypothetical protein
MLGDGIFQQRRTTMNYTKPEVNTLGDATTVIERINGHKPPTVTTDAPPVPTASPAYDLDE